ncbi:rubredoxin, partial [Escherichia coli]|nr:rubredoxin [Escherichia coli]
ADIGPRMQCIVCQWIYDPAKGEPMQDVAPGTPWSEVPDNFLCPECSLGKDNYVNTRRQRRFRFDFYATSADLASLINTRSAFWFTAPATAGCSLK